MILTWAAAIKVLRSSCCDPRDQDSGSGGGRFGITGAGSGAGEIATGCNSTGSAATSGTVIVIACRQYETATPRCQKRGIKRSSKVSWLIMNAPNTFAGATSFIQAKSPPTKIIPAIIAAA